MTEGNSAAKISAKNEDGTIGKGLKILDIVAGFGQPVRFNDVQDASPFPKASTYRFLQTLTNQQMLSFDREAQKYSLGMRLVTLAHSAWRHYSIGPIAAPHLDKLSAKTGETIHLAQMDHGQVLYVDKRNASKPISMFSDAGKIGPAYCTGVGKAMLAFLEESQCQQAIQQQSFYRHTDKTLTSAEALTAELMEIRKSGVSFDREEHEANIICVAVPILTEQQQVVGGMSITNSTQRMTLEELANYAPALKETAQEIGKLASNWQFPSN